MQKKSLAFALFTVVLTGVSAANPASITIINNLHDLSPKIDNTLTFTPEQHANDIVMPKTSSWQTPAGSKTLVQVSPLDGPIAYMQVSGSGDKSAFFSLELDNTNNHLTVHGYVNHNLAYSWYVPYSNTIVFCEESYATKHGSCLS